MYLVDSKESVRKHIISSTSIQKLRSCCFVNYFPILAVAFDFVTAVFTIGHATFVIILFLLLFLNSPQTPSLLNRLYFIFLHNIEVLYCHFSKDIVAFGWLYVTPIFEKL